MADPLWWYCAICGAGVAGAGLLFALGGLGWLLLEFLQGTLRRMGMWAMFLAWIRQQWLAGRYPRMHRWIFREDLPTPDPGHLEGCAALEPGSCTCGRIYTR